MKEIHKARWIWTPGAFSVNQYAEFTATFPLEAAFARVRLFISADSHYAVWLNGKAIDASPFSDYPQKKTVDEADITAFVRAGDNTLCILGYCQGEDSSVYRFGAPGILFAVQADGRTIAASGKDTLCRPAQAYASGPMEKFSGQLSYAFHYDADKDDGWREPGYVPAPSAGWTAAKETGASPELAPRPVEPLRVLPPRPARIACQGVFTDEAPAGTPCGDRMQRAALAFRTAAEMGAGMVPPPLPCEEGIRLAAEGGDGLFLLVDLQQEEAGWLHLDLDLPAGTLVLIGFGEHLDDLRVRASVGGRQFAAVYGARAGRQQFTHRFKRLGCRYIQLHIYARAATVYYAGVRPTVYPVVYRPAFTCADSLHNRIFEVGRRTLELCMHEHYEDCPWREQALYAMDSRNQMLCGYMAFEGYAFAQSSLRLLADGQREDGLLELCAPARVAVTIPAFSLSFITAVWENVLYSGDEAFGREMLPVVERILDVFLERRADNGMVPCFAETPYWNFYEWKEGLDGEPMIREAAAPSTFDAPLNGFLSLALADAAALYGRLGNTERGGELLAVRDDLNRAMAVFWDEEEGAFCTRLEEDGGKSRHFAELTQALLLCAGAAGEEQAARLLERLARPDNGWVPVTLSSYLYKYEALMRRPDRYAPAVMADIARVWGAMLFAGATSFWETDLGADDFGYAGSLCHGWSAVPVYFYYRYALGVQPGTDERAPVFCGLYEVGEKNG